MDPLTDELCRWSAPDGAASIFLAASTVRDLRAKVIEAFLLLPRRGVETGGLLFGSGHSGQQFIHGFEEIPCEHRYGPSFTLSADEQAALTEKLTRLQRKSESGVIGLYRSYTGRKPEVDAADLELVREHFPKGQFVFLLLQPLNAQTCRAGFRLCQDGELLAQPVFTPVPFDPELFSSDQFSGDDYAPELETTPELEPEPEPRAEPVAQPVQLAPTPGDPIPAPLASPEPAPPPPVVRQLPPPYRSIFAVPAAREPVAPPAAARKTSVVAAGLGYAWSEPSAAQSALRTAWGAFAAAPLGGSLSGCETVRRCRVSRDHLGRRCFPNRRRYPRFTGRQRWRSPSRYPAHRLAAATRPLSLHARESGAGTAHGPVRRGPCGLRRHTSIRRRAASCSCRLPCRLPPPCRGTAEARAPGRAGAGHTRAEKRAAIHENQPPGPAGIRNRLTHQLEIPVIVRINSRGAVTSASTSPTGDGLRRYLAQEAVKAACQWRFAPTRALFLERTLYFTFAQ